jgi:hypothetical protein
MAKLAIILHDGHPGWREERLGSMLDFFGVPRAFAVPTDLGKLVEQGSKYAILGSIRQVAAVLQQGREHNLPEASFAYVDDEQKLCLESIRSLLGNPNLLLRDAPENNVQILISRDLKELAGPMSGLQFSLKLNQGDAILTGALVPEETTCSTLITADKKPVFLRLQHPRGCVFLSTTSQVVDLERPLRARFYDIKDDFCSAVPLVLFIQSMFAEIAWQPQELGACLIIDDPLLKPKYGSCNFARLRDLMSRFGFTTNIAFIPWNWRRTSPSARNFFDFDSGQFSISIHGCDHTGGEFATSSLNALNSRAQLACQRMRNHEARTGIKHDRIMVFPQGAFSSICPEVLKYNGFLATVNTEITPLASEDSRTTIQDVWDVAIRTYGNFPIFTRRYAYHGLENFAFDILLGKPCFIVSHHDFFKDDGRALIELMEQICSLNCHLQWRSPEQVVRRAFRRRMVRPGMLEIEMFCGELIVRNASDSPLDVRTRKPRGTGEVVSQVWCDDKATAWRVDGDYILFESRIDAFSETRFRIILQDQAPLGTENRTLKLELAIAARRILSEVRDEYLSESSYYSVFTNKLRNVGRKSA